MVLGKDTTQFGSAHFKSQIGILSDNSSLYERLTIYDNLKLFCKLYHAPLHQIDNILRDVHLHDAKKNYIEIVKRNKATCVAC